MFPFPLFDVELMPKSWVFEVDMNDLSGEPPPPELDYSNLDSIYLVALIILFVAFVFFFVLYNSPSNLPFFQAPFLA